MSAKKGGNKEGKKGDQGRSAPGRSLKYRFFARGKETRPLSRKLNSLNSIEQAFKKTEARNKALIEAVPGGLFLLNREGVCLEYQVPDEQQFHAMCRIDPGKESPAGRTLQASFETAAAAALLQGIKKVFEQGGLQVVAFSSGSAEQKRHFEARLVSSGREEVLALVREVATETSSEARPQHLSLRDPLTGLYNRAYFEDELKRLEGGREYPVALISADLDGLKLINDAFGYKAGDKYLLAGAGVLKQSVRGSDILARMGGDEFALILPSTVSMAGEQLLGRIRRQIEDYNRKHSTLPLSMAMGMAFSEGQKKPLEEVCREADRLMYEDKRQRSINARSEIVRAILASFFQRDKTGESYNDQMQQLCIKLGRKAGLKENQLSDLELLARVYDLGKVTISEDILNKQGKLTEAEWETVRQHVEKGYRIASASSDLSAVAELILLHHENYDGSGYPLGLKGDAIPIECRIIAVLDAYMAMLKRRPYGRSLTVKEAIYELDYCSGWQFDPRLIPLLASVV